MKKCLRCGNENADEMRFCLNCGNSLDEASNLAQTAPRASNRKWLFAVVGLTAILLLLAGVGAVAALIAFTRQDSAINTASENAQTVAATNNRTASSRANSNNVNSSSASDSGDSDEPTKSGEFDVAANQGWQTSDIKVVERERFITTVSGKINLADIKNGVSPNGVNDAGSKARRIYPQFPTGALLMRTKLDAGGYSNISAFAQNPLGVWQNGKDERGVLEFAVNDNNPAGNSGEFAVGFVMSDAEE